MTRIFGSKISLHEFVVNKPVFCVSVSTGMVVVRRNGKVLVGSNCSQEPRITVHYGVQIKDKSAELVAAAYHANPRIDYHQKVRDMVEEVSGVSILRKQAKTLNLGLAYGLGKKKLMVALEVETDTAEQILDAYHSSVPYVRKLQKLTTAKAERVGEIRTLLGRKRSFGLFWRVPYQQGDKPLPFDEAKRTWPNSRLERAGAYKALNALIQGSAADQTKRAMVMCHNAGLKMLATVHDELCFSVSSEAEIRRAIEIMENAVELAVPMKVDVEVGPSWGELEEFKQ
jgi:DNA polymerase-1